MDGVVDWQCRFSTLASDQSFKAIDLHVDPTWPFRFKLESNMSRLDPLTASQGCVTVEEGAKLLIVDVTFEVNPVDNEL